MHNTHPTINKNQIEAFKKMLECIQPENLPIELYPQQYLSNLLNNKKYFVEIYAKTLIILLENIYREKQEICLVDYGAGTGLLGLFAKFCGFKDVILVDMSPEFCVCQEVLSKKLGISINIICGNVENLQSLKKYKPDAVVGTDVIEHIYDLDVFFSHLNSLNNKIVSVFTTAANEKNWIKTRKMMKIQHQDEWLGWHKKGELQIISFREVRKNIILQILPDIQAQALNDLVKHTRGLKKREIVDACLIYKKNLSLPTILKHPTNTCDPFTGSWTEKLISFEEYRRLYNNYGYELTIKNGHYNIDQFFPKGMLLNLINIFIRILGKAGTTFSPYIVLIGKNA